MKKICMLVAVAIALVAGFACTQDEKQVKLVKTEKQMAFEELQLRIDALNAEFGVGDVNSRGFWSTLKKIWKVVKADALATVTAEAIKEEAIGGLLWGEAGAIVIAVVNGVDASADEASAQFQQSKGEQKYVPERTLNNFEDLFEEGVVPTQLDSVGFYHNHIICDLYDTYGDDLYTMDEAMREGLVVQYARKYLDFSESITKLPELEELNTLNQIVLDMDEENMDASFEAIGQLLPNCVEELQVVENYCRTLITFESDEELILYTKAHNNIVLDSELSEYSKELVKIGTNVGIYSSGLWTPKKGELLDDEPIEP